MGDTSGLVGGNAPIDPSNVEQLRPIDELSLVAALLARAFANDPMLVHADPDPRRRSRWLHKLYRSTTRYSQLTGGVELIEGRGAALWLQNQTEPRLLQAIFGGMLGVPFALGLRTWFRIARHEAFCTARVRLLCPLPYGYLWLLGVDPSAQGQGFGRLAVQAALEAMRARGHQLCVLKTETPENVAFYQNLGFECIDEQVVPSSGIRYWLFSRTIGPAPALPPAAQR
ncbi:MAG TPA: GNAT family N-acetyltransferase [Polyangiaceae bacterium]|nr:GNAT family N-acetyltransferase [Polyangiaceae bacterium]